MEGDTRVEGRAGTWVLIVSLFLGAFLGTVLLPSALPMEVDHWCLLDIEAFVESPSLALDANDRPWVLTANRTTLAVSIGDPELPDWILEPVPATALPVESRGLEFGSTGVVHVLAYAGTPDGRIDYLRRDGGNWTTEVLSPERPEIAGLAIDGHGEPRVAMRPHNATTRLTDITYGWRAAGAWTFERVQGIDAAGRGSAIALSPDGTPHLAYGVARGFFTATLRYAVRVGGTWSFVDLSENLTGAQPPGLAVNSSGTPRVVGGTPDGVEVFTRTRAGWSREVVGNGTALNAAVALGPDEEPHLAYFRADPAPASWRLTYAHHTTRGWESEDVVTGHHIGGIQIRVDRGGTPHLAFYDITADRVVYGVRGPCPSSNSRPIADAGGPYAGTEGSPVRFTAQGSSDPNGDALRFRWDFNGDGTWDTGWSPNSTATFTWGDDYSGTVRVEVQDTGLLNDTAQTSIKVTNVSPTVTNLTIAPATPGCNGGGDEHGNRDGEHEHEDNGCRDRDHDCHDDDRDEGCKDHDDEGGCRDEDKDHEHDGRDKEGHDHEESGCGCRGGNHDDEEHDHEHDDDDKEGGTCGTTFVFNATAYDPGSDDLTFFWEFGDGTNASHTYYNNGVSPDPYPSPGPTFPVNMTNETTHSYATSGTFTVTLIVSDDDGGSMMIVFRVVI